MAYDPPPPKCHNDVNFSKNSLEMPASVPLTTMSESQFVIGPFTVSVKVLGIEYHMGDRPGTQCDRTCCLTEGYNNTRKSHTLHVHVPVIEF